MSKTKLVKKGVKTPKQEETVMLYVRDFPARMHDELKFLAIKTKDKHADVLTKAIRAYKRELKAK